MYGCGSDGGHDSHDAGRGGEDNRKGGDAGRGSEDRLSGGGGGGGGGGSGGGVCGSGSGSGSGSKSGSERKVAAAPKSTATEVKIQEDTKCMPRTPCKDVEGRGGTQGYPGERQNAKDTTLD